MRQRLRSHLTYANVISTLALFLVLGGGTALASYVISSNSQVGPGTISGHKPPSGKHANIIGGTVNGQDLAINSVTGADINEATLSLPVAVAQVPLVVAQTNDCFSSLVKDEDYSPFVNLRAGTYLVLSNNNHYETGGGQTTMMVEDSLGQSLTTPASDEVDSGNPNGGGGSSFGTLELTSAKSVRVHAIANIVGCGLAQLSGTTVTFVRVA
jgi:hypothetical protein